MNVKMGKRFFRYCDKCGRRFNPNGRYQKLCIKCHEKVRNVNFIKMIYHRKNIK